MQGEAYTHFISHTYLQILGNVDGREQVDKGFVHWGNTRFLHFYAGSPNVFLSIQGMDGFAKKISSVEWVLRKFGYVNRRIIEWQQLHRFAQ